MNSTTDKEITLDGMISEFHHYLYHKWNDNLHHIHEFVISETALGLGIKFDHLDQQFHAATAANEGTYHG